MKLKIDRRHREVLRHLYISPLEFCNLCCKMCYTTKTKQKLSQQEILDFITRYRQVVAVQTVTFCGGEVFLMPDFPDTVNAITGQGIVVQIITNGTIGNLAAMVNPDLVNLIVSVDGLESDHDRNRGQGRWRQSLEFLQHAESLGFHTEVFSIVTKETLSLIGAFEDRLHTELKHTVPVTYHPRKPMSYLTHHPSSNRVGELAGFSFISSGERHALGKVKKIFPPPQLGCYQMSVMSDGKVYGCCEGIHPLGKLTDDITHLIHQFETRLRSSRMDCIEPDFNCGLEG